MRPDVEEGGSRLRLSMPDELDAVLAELAARTGRSKASYALEALSWYLPKLHALAVDLRALQGGEYRRAAREGVRERSTDNLGRALPVGDQAELPLTRQQRRALEREGRKGRQHRA